MTRRQTHLPPGRASPQALVGRSVAMQRLRDQIDAVARRLCTVLIQGESGTGKELVAREIHARSQRRAAPFIPVDCTTCTEALFESQLFGHREGSFTGAVHATLGFLRAADRGTLFLDEIGELTAAAQAKLLRCIQERAVTPVGDVQPVPVDIRIIAATHRDLADLVRRGRFREDLFFRINVVCISVPPLRDRRADVRLLAQYFLAELARLYDEPVKALADDAANLLQWYDWPGNVRELENAMEVAVAFCPKRVVDTSVLPQSLCASLSATSPHGEATASPLEAAERALIAEALRASGGNQSQAAHSLHLERHRLHRKIVRYGLQSMTRCGHR